MAATRATPQSSVNANLRNGSYLARLQGPFVCCATTPSPIQSEPRAGSGDKQLVSRPHQSLYICGRSGGSNLGQSLFWAAGNMVGVVPHLLDEQQATSSNRYINGLSWRLRDKQPMFSRRYNRQVLETVKGEGSIVVSTGLCPVSEITLQALRLRGAICLHFSSDDPWNPTQRAKWHHRALPNYDIVYTPRLSNMSDLRSLGCHDVRYLPFAFDPKLFPDEVDRDPTAGIQSRALFVGGADADRVAFARAFLGSGFELALVGGYWDQFPDLKPFWLHHRPATELGKLTRTAAVNLILVRRANRDGHVMRSFEAGAIGGCLVVEDTPEHRNIFGEDGEAVRYFREPFEAARVCRQLAANAIERQRLAHAVKVRIRAGAHTYADRLATMLADAADLHARRRAGSLPAASS